LLFLLVASGHLPFVLAERLARPLFASCTHLLPEPDGWHVATALPGGARRHLRAPGPLVLTVGAAGPQPLLSAFAAARRGRITTVGTAGASAALSEVAAHRTGAASALDPRLTCPVRPARARPRPIAGPPSGDPAQRLAAILGGGRPDGNRRLVDVDAEAAAAGILDELRSGGCLTAADNQETAS
jgi:electron transfer flavoprotein beta subunit